MNISSLSTAPNGWNSARLAFARPTLEAYQKEIAKFVADGRNCFVIHDDGDPALIEAVRKHLEQLGHLVVSADSADPNAANLHFAADAGACSATLMTYIDRPVPIIVPRTTHHYSERPVFCVSIPKTGFHLMSRVLSDMGYTHRGRLEGRPDPQSAYTFMRDHPHLTCNDLFTNLAHEQDGGAGAEIFRHPVVFCYRHPADIAVSEAGYYAEDSATALASYYGAMPFADRLLRLIGDDGMIGTLRDRVAAYKEWMDMPNVIAVSFEEMVGAPGGGSTESQLAVLWSMQLKLHVPGEPKEFARYIFGGNSRTFRSGLIGRYREVFDERHYKAMASLDNTDFLDRFGYGTDLLSADSATPRLAPALRHRPLVMRGTPSPTETPDVNAATDSATVAEGVLYRWYGYYVGMIRSRYVAIEPGQPRFDPFRDETSARYFVAATIEALERSLAAAPLAAEPTLSSVDEPGFDTVFRARLNVQPLFADVAGYKVVLARGKFIGVPPQIGDLDEDVVDFNAIPGLIIGDEQDEVIERISRTADVPWLIEKSFAGRNLVRYQGIFFAIPLDRGEIDLTKAETRANLDLLRHDDLDALKSMIREHIRAQLDDGQPHLVREGFHGFNLVYLNGSYFAVPQCLGAIELDMDSASTVPGVLVSASREELEAAVLATMSGEHPGSCEAGVLSDITAMPSGGESGIGNFGRDMNEFREQLAAFRGELARTREDSATLDVDLRAALAELRVELARLDRDLGSVRANPMVRLGERIRYRRPRETHE
jgi:hypothetical protein